MKPRYLLFAALLPFAANPLLAASPGDACAEAARLAADNQIDEALEEARWCVESLEQVKQASAAEEFPSEVGGFSGGEVNQQAAMGMNMLGRTYTRGTEQIEVNYTQGSGAGAGLAALAQMGMSMGGAKKLRIQRYTVLDMSDGSDLELSVPLKNGGILNVNSSNVSHDTLTGFLEAFPLADIDK